MIPVFTPGLFFPKVGAAYAGPGDVVAGASAWWGLRAYTLASIGGNVVKIRRSSDSTTKIFVSQTSGGIDQTDAFFDGSNYFVDTLYDQTGNGNNQVQATAGSQPQVFLNTIGGTLPTISFTGFNLATSGAFTLAQPFTVSWIAKRTGNTGSYNSVIGTITDNVQTGFNASVDNAFMYASGAISPKAATDNVYHAVQAVFNGASSDLNIDGSANSNSPGTQGFGSVTYMSLATSNPLTGNIVEAGIWGSAFTGTQSSNMSSNQHTYWGI